MRCLDVLKEFHQLGCNDSKKCSIAYRVYMDLLNGNGSAHDKYSNLEKLYHKQLNIIYINGKYKENECHVILPSLSTDMLDFRTIMELQQTINPSYYVILAITDTSSNVLYYQFTEGIVYKTEHSASTTE